MARIIAGEYRGRHIDVPKGSDTRPTTDRVREALMSSLESRLPEGFEGIRVLDAFAGSGALGLECLSRGAAFCLFCDNDGRARKVIASNFKALSLASSRYALSPSDMFEAAERGRVQGGPFDLVLLDPPYARSAEEVLALIGHLASGGFLAASAVIAYEHENAAFDLEALELPPGLEAPARHRYGKTMISTFRWKDVR